MKGSEGLWNEDELLTQMEQMQDQIDQLEQEKDELSRTLAEKEILLEKLEQTSSSEISKLQSTLQQAQRKLQEQSDQIVTLSGADVILRDNEKLKEENVRLQSEKEQSEKEDARVEEACKRRLQKKDEKVQEKCREIEEDRERIRRKEAKADEMIRDSEHLIRSQVQEREKLIRDECVRDFDHLLNIARDGWNAAKIKQSGRLIITGLYALFLSALLAVKSGAHVIMLQAIGKIGYSIRDGWIWIFTQVSGAAELSQTIPVPTLSIIIRWGIMIIMIGAFCTGILFLIFLTCRWCIRRLKGRISLWHILVVLSCSIMMTIFL